MTIDELFKDASKGCSMEGCNHKHQALVLHAQCHPDANMSVKIDVDKGTLRVACAICDEAVCTINHVMSN